MTVPRPESEPSTPHARPRRPRPPPHGSALLATYGQRVGGFLIDIGIPLGLLAIVLLAALSADDVVVIVVVHSIVTVTAVAFVVWNCGYLQGRSGQSLGKRALRTRLVSANTGEPVGFARAVGRQVVHVLDALPLCLGYLWPLWDEQRQTFADKVCSTQVVHSDL